MKESVKNLDDMGIYLSSYNKFHGERNVGNVAIKDLMETDYTDIKLIQKLKSKHMTSYYFEFPKHNNLFENRIVAIDNVNKVIMDNGETGNRIHIDNIGDKIKGFGLAYKVYQKAIDKFGYVSTDGSTTENIKNVWRRLITNDDYNILIYKGLVNVNVCAACVETPTKIECPQCDGKSIRLKFNCTYCNNVGFVDCSHITDKTIKQFIFISKDLKTIQHIKSELIKSGMLNLENIMIY